MEKFDKVVHAFKDEIQVLVKGHTALHVGKMTMNPQTFSVMAVKRSHSAPAVLRRNWRIELRVNEHHIIDQCCDIV